MADAHLEMLLLGGRYVCKEAIASGGMATVHFGLQIGEAGFTRPVAIKKLHPQYAKNEELVAMFLDEARIAARILHGGVAQTLDVGVEGREPFLVLEYVNGESLDRLLRECSVRDERVPVGIAATIASRVLHALHAAHETTGANGELLHIVHRDVSPHNILVGKDGIVRLIDFGVAKALGRARTTRDGSVRGKLDYMAPEQLSSQGATAKSDVYAASVVLWEMLTGRRFFSRERASENEHDAEIPPELDAIVKQGLAQDPLERFETARAMALAIEAATQDVAATASEIGAWVEDLAGPVLAAREEYVLEMERGGAASMTTTTDKEAEPEPTRTQTLPWAAPKQEEKTARRSRPWVMAVQAIVVALALVIVVVVVQRGRLAPEEKRVDDATLSPVAPTSPPTSITSASESPSAPVVIISSTPPSSPRFPPPTRSTTTRAAAAKRPGQQQPPSCDPPFRIDVNGHKIAKPECL